MKHEDRITVLVCEVGKYPYTKEIDNELKALRKEIGGGYIQVTYPWTDTAAIVCDDEGKINGLEPNRGLRTDGKNFGTADGELYDVVAGTFLVVGLDNDECEFVSLTDKQIEHYSELFRYPEFFYEVNGKLESEKVFPEEAAEPISDKKLISEIKRLHNRKINKLLSQELTIDDLDIESIVGLAMEGCFIEELEEMVENGEDISFVHSKDIGKTEEFSRIMESFKKSTPVIEKAIYKAIGRMAMNDTKNEQKKSKDKTI